MRFGMRMSSKKSTFSLEIQMLRGFVRDIFLCFIA